MQKHKKIKISGEIEEEARAFDRQTVERITHGMIPDLRRLKKAGYFYNNPWREPEFFRLQIQPRVDFILKGIGEKKKRVAEFGCGYGFLSLEIARAGHDVVGLDVSPKSIAVAQRFFAEAKKGRGFGSLEYRVQDMMAMDLGKNSFDAVVFLGSLHHIAEPARLLRKVHDSLTARGRLLVCEPVRENFTKESAWVAGALRLALPTWEPYRAKLKNLASPRDIEKYLDAIYGEYTYRDERQSPHDNLTASEHTMLSAIKKFFTVKKIEHADAFIDKLIGGLRGSERYGLARSFKLLDQYAVDKKLLPPTSIRVLALKR
jgi:2-polyprenyl-6-hydroxyphenyl methylase/3-demethylubiquinone-9 3-methyltransferase